jgi:hypothetical protein
MPTDPFVVKSILAPLTSMMQLILVKEPDTFGRNLTLACTRYRCSHNALSCSRDIVVSVRP